VAVTDLLIKVVADASSAVRELGQADDATSKTQKTLGRMAVPAAAAVVAIAGFGVAAAKSASDAEQAFGAVNAVFGKSSSAIHDFGKTSASSVGLATSEYEQMAAVFGAQLKNMGVASDQLAPKTNDLVTMGADLAAQFGGPTSQAVEALGSLLRGETDPIEQYGVSIKQADIKARMAADGTDKLTGAAAKQAQTQALLALVTEQTASSTGAFARETDSAAGASQIAAAQYENTKAALGQALLPAIVAVMGALSGLAGFLGDHVGLTQTLIGVIGGLSVVVLAANAALKAMAVAEGILGLATSETTGKTVAQRVATIANTAATKAAELASKAWAIANRVLAVTMYGIPIFAIIAGIMLLVGAIIYAYKNSETFRRIVDAAFDAVLSAARACWTWIKANWPLLLAILTGPIGIAVVTIARHWDAIKDGAQAVLGWLRGAWGAITGILVGPFQSAWNTISGIIGQIRSAVSSVTNLINSIPKPKIPDLNPFKSAPASYTAQSATLRGVTRAPAAATTSGGGGVVVNISGAIDPEGTARAVARVLTQHGIRTGRASTLATAAAI
jgi:hypothetical protein